MRWQQLRDQATSQLGMYLPVLIMALIALCSWWLLRNAPSHESDAPAQVARHEPDYFMRDFTVKEYMVSGQLKNELHGKEMLHFPDSQQFELTMPTFVAFDDQDHRMNASAKRGTSNADASLIELFDDAEVERIDIKGKEAPLRFSGAHLRVFGSDRRVESDLPVTLKRGPDTFKGGTLRYDHSQGMAQLGAPVTALLPGSGQRQP